MRCHSECVGRRHNDKLEMLYESQDRSLLNGFQNNVFTMYGLELTKIVVHVLSIVPKHPIREKFNGVHFLADVDRLVHEGEKTDCERLCKKELSAKRYAKNVLEKPIERIVKKLRFFEQSKTTSSSI